MFRSLAVATSECHATHGAHLHGAQEPLALYFVVAVCVVLAIVSILKSKG
jgi:hypothetical protein